MSIITNIISAVTAAGIDCEREYCRVTGYNLPRGRLYAYAGIKKIKLDRLRNGVSDAFVQVRVTVQAFGADGAVIQNAAEKVVVPAVMGCGEEIYGVEISETFYDVKSDRVYCEIIFDVRRCGYDICG